MQFESQVGTIHRRLVPYSFYIFSISIGNYPSFHENWAGQLKCESYFTEQTRTP